MRQKNYKVKDFIEIFQEGSIVVTTNTFYMYYNIYKDTKYSVRIDPGVKFLICELSPENKEEQISWINYKQKKMTEVKFNTLIISLYSFDRNEKMNYGLYFKDENSIIEISFQLL